jgi:hypothetical protein
MHKQMKSLREYTKLEVVIDMLRSFDLENQDNNTYDYFL